MENNLNVKEFYEKNYNEDEREGREGIEYVRSRMIISRYLTQGEMEIADVGGATGAYSFWLGGMGHRVHLLDLASNHIEIAKKKSQESGILLASYVCGDARKLPYGDNSMDIVLLMGALYHLHLTRDRMMCLEEAFRVLKPGGVIVCTVMNRYSLVIAAQKYKLFDDYSREYITQTTKTGVYDKANFYGHTPDELISEIGNAKFDEVKLIAVEGIANALGDNQLPVDEREAARLLWSIELTESLPSMMGVSRNIIGIGKKPLL